MTLDDKLSELWRKYEKDWGFEVPPDVREYYESVCLVRERRDNTALQELEYDLGRMGLLVNCAHGKGIQSSKKPGQRASSYMRPLMKRVNFAKRVAKTFIDVGQDPYSDRHSWQPVADKLNADNPSEHWTPDALRKDWHHAMSGTAVAGSVSAWLNQGALGQTITLGEQKQIIVPLSRGTHAEVDFSEHHKARASEPTDR